MKDFRLFLSVFLALLIGFGIVGATTTTLNKPADGENITVASYTLNCTVTALTAATAAETVETISNCSFYDQTAGGSGWTLITTVENTSADQREFTYAWAAIQTTLADGRYDFNATCRGNTNVTKLKTVTSDENINVGIDDTYPTVTITSFTTNVRPTDAFTVNGTYSDTGFSSDVPTCTYFEESGFDKSGGQGGIDTTASSFGYTYTPTLKGWRSFWINCADLHGYNTTTSKTVNQFSVSKALPGVVTQPPPYQPVQPPTQPEKSILTQIGDAIRGFIDWLKNLLR